jgi:hypothetical protein
MLIVTGMFTLAATTALSVDLRRRRPARRCWSWPTSPPSPSAR